MLSRKPNLFTFIHMNNIRNARQGFRSSGSSVGASDRASASQEAPSERRTGLPLLRKLRRSVGQGFRFSGSSVRASDRASASQEAPSERRTGLPFPRKLRRSVGQGFLFPGSSVRALFPNDPSSRRSYNELLPHSRHGPTALPYDDDH